MAATTPKQILLLRHGEKPGDPATDNDADGIDLSTRGFERAGALAAYIPATFGKPDFLFATQASKHSNRPVETITPLAQGLNLVIDSKHADADFQKVADDILGNAKYAGKLVLICWHHGKIPDLTTALGGNPPVSPWPGNVFDRVWQLDYPEVGGTPNHIPVKNLAQTLLYGDSSV
jgi:phosphohistidine phosphatase SixA